MSDALPLPFPYVPGTSDPGSFEDRTQQNLDAIAIAVGGLRVSSVWQSPSYTNSWADFSVSRVGRYRTTPDGMVHLEGIIKNGTTGTAAFNLPAGHRPAQTLAFPAVGSASSAYVEVATNGDVTPQNVPGPGNYIYLSTVRFFAG